MAKARPSDVGSVYNNSLLALETVRMYSVIHKCKIYAKDYCRVEEVRR